MADIKKLSEKEVLKIAAGEVVERPASVVKELVENSLDARATSIVIKINNAGKDLIEIIDDGVGMSKINAKNSVLPYWTSKINSVEDLHQLTTFGFRGEALASINAVSKLKMTTRTAEQAGLELSFNFGELETEQVASAPVGTKISITNLFENVPVRRKFLKQNETEFQQILILIQHFSLANPQVNLKLYKDEQLFLNAPATKDLKNRVCQIWDYSMQNSLIELAETTYPGLTIKGLISNGKAVRYSRSGIFLLLNGRPIKDQKIQRAIISAYDQILAPNQLPVCFLLLQINPEMVDVNIHPRKEEVRFAKHTEICSQIKTALKKQLEQLVSQQVNLKSHNNDTYDYGFSENLNQNFSVQENNAAQFFNNNFTKNLTTAQNPENVLNSNDFQDPASNNAEQQFKQLNLDHNFELLKNPERIESPKIEWQQKNLQPQSEGKIIGQLMQTFILVEQNDSLVIIDQHAAHERILYEKYKTSLKNLASNQLIFPEIIELDPAEIKLLLNQTTLFESFGIIIEEFARAQLLLRATPCTLGTPQTVDILRQSLSQLSQHQHLPPENLRDLLAEHLYAEIACKTSIKANAQLTIEVMSQILKDLQQTPNRFECIHGRPTIWELEKRKLYNTFKRPFNF